MKDIRTDRGTEKDIGGNYEPKDKVTASRYVIACPQQSSYQ